MSRHLLTATFDAATELKDAGAVTANGAGTVGAVPRVVNLGNAFVHATLVVDVDVIDISSNDEGYDIRLQVSSSPTFASDVHTVATVKVGKASATGDSADKVVGRYEKSFINSPDGATPYAYARIYTQVAGTTPSVNYRAFITKSPL